jgi:transcriptional regulator CtsR
MSKYYWFIEPLDAHTNEVIAKYLEQVSSAELTTIDSDKKAFFIIPSQINYINRSKKEKELDYRIYRKTGKNGQIEDVSFLYDQDRKKKNKIAKIKEKIKKRIDS